jgi:hypothetical protein
MAIAEVAEKDANMAHALIGYLVAAGEPCIMPAAKPR